MPNVFSDSAKRHCLIEFLVLATFCRFFFSPLQLFVISEAAFRANSFWFISKRNFCVLLPPANEVCEGYVFTGVCHSVHGGGGVRGCSRGACMVAPGGHAWLLPGGGGHAWLPGGHAWLLWGGCTWLLLGGMCGCSGGHVWLPGGHAWLLQGGWGMRGCSRGGHAWFFR